MVITSFKIDGFGILYDAGIEALEPGLILICAENGGGKTTLRDFFRAMLFGLPTRGGNKYQPVSGGIHGGKLGFRTQNDQNYHLTRTFSPNRVALNQENGQAVPDLSPLLSHASLDLYKNIFAIGLPELQDAQVLDSAQVKAMIGGAGSGHSGRALLDALKELNGEMEDRFKKSGQNPLINKLLTTLETDGAQHRRMVLEAEHYWEYEQELADLNETIADLKSEEKEAHIHYAHLALLKKAWGDWVALLATRRDLVSLSPSVDSFPEHGTERLNAIKKALLACGEELESLQSEITSKRRQRDAIVVSLDVLEQGHAIDTAYSSLSLFEQNRQNVARHREEVSRLAQQMRVGLKSLGNWSLEQLEQFDDSLPSLAEKALIVEALKSAHTRLLQSQALQQGLGRDAMLAEEAWKANQQQWVTRWAQTPPSHEWLEEKSIELHQLKTALAELANLQAAREGLEQDVSEAAARISALEADLTHVQEPASQSFPFRACAIAVLAVALMIAALSFRTPVVAVLTLVCGVVGFGLFWKAGAAPLQPSSVSTASLPLERELSDWRERHQTQVQKVQAHDTRLEQLQSRIVSLSEPFKRAVSSQSDCDQIQTILQRQRGERREWEATQTKVQDLEGRAVDTKRRLGENSEELARLEAQVQVKRTEWSRWLTHRQLDGGMLLETFEEVHRQIQQSRRDKSELDIARAEVARVEGMISTYREQVRAVLIALGRPYPLDEKVAGAVIALVEERKAAGQAANDQNTLNEKLQALEANEVRLRTRYQGFEAERQALLLEGIKRLEELSAAQETASFTEAEFLTRAGIWAEKCRLEALEKSRLQNLETLSAPGDKLQLLLQELAATNYEDIEGSVIEAQARQQEIAARLGEQYHRHGELTQILLNLATGDDVAQLAQQVTGEQCELQELAEEWAVRKLGCWLMEKARAKFQEERQPAVLREAGAYLATISGGEFTRVIQPLGTDDYQLQRPDGSLKEGREYWNTGLKEQTYLSLRLGLMEDYGTRAEPLPVILDDALVNFDPARLEGAVQCIMDFAQHHQVLYFTCHSHTLGLFAEQDHPVSAYRICGGKFEKISLR